MNDPLAEKTASPRVEDNLADAIADLWHDIETQAVAESREKKNHDEALIFEWAQKLATILKGRQR